MASAHDFMSSLLDEIALEGLDGITLEMLWQRIADRPYFPIALDDDSKNFFWDNIAKHKEIEIYKLLNPRKFEPIYNRYDHVDPELEVVLESQEKIPDPYFPIVLVKDYDIRGSCATYETRKCITSEIRCGNDVLLMSLNQVIERWGDHLVLVASPKVRLLALIGTESNPLLDLSLEAYCLLERIGRSRYLGEVTQGEGGILALKAPFCKQLHYYRKKLTLKGLITKQNHYMKNKKGATCNGSLFHLTRFYVQRKTKMATLMKRLCDILREKPQNRESCKELKQEMGIKDCTFKKLFYRPFQRWVKLLTLTCQEFFPFGTHKDWYTVGGHEKTVKVVQLIKHCDEDDEKEDDEVADDKSGALPANVHFDASKIYYGVPLVLQLYEHIKDAGPEGASAGDLGRKMTLPRLDIRCLLGLLSKKGLIITVLQDRGRQKVKKNIAKIYANQNKDYSSLQEQEDIMRREAMQVNGENENASSSKRKENFVTDSGDGTPACKRIKLNDSMDAEEVSDSGNNAAVVKNEVESNYQNIVSQVLELQNKSHFTGKAPRVVSFLDNPSVPPPYAGTTQLTYRKLKRSNMILEYLKSERFSTISDIQKYITEKEKEEGYSFKLDKKSTARLVYSLYNNKKLKIFKAELKLEDEQTMIEFICDSSLMPSDPHIQVAIEQAKFKFFGVSKDGNKKSQVNGNKENSSQHKSSKLASAADKNTGTKEKAPKKAAPSVQPSTADNVPGYPRMTPKFKRAKALHTFLYYLAYHHKGMDLGKYDEQRVYHESMTWKRFVPPLPPSPDHVEEGWVFLTHIYQRMPLSLFIKIVNFRQGIPGLNAYLENEEKSHYLMPFLSQTLRNSLMNNRKYLFSTNDVIKVLCYMGLVSIGPQASKEKDQVFVYVHKHASIKDTTISPPGYIHVKPDLNYEVKSYRFDSEDDVDTFWLDLESIAFHTPLGKYSAAVGVTIAITEANFKPELTAATKNKSMNEVVDDGTIPGDGLGAGGFDSILFLHSRRNWQPSAGVKSIENTRNFNKKAEPVHSMQHLLRNTEAAKTEIHSRLQRLTKNTLLHQKENKMERQNAAAVKKIDPKLVQTVGKRKRTKLRTIQLRKSKKRTPYYDEKDKAAMEKMDKTRCDWSSQEDSFLLLCKVASSFLDPLCSKNLVVPYTVVRDLLHRQIPGISANKSSRACQRRVRYMMLNPATINNVNVFLGEALQDADLVKEFNRPKPPKSNEEVWAGMFTTVVNKLLEKFTLPASDRCKNVVLPNSLQEFHEHFNIEPYDKLNEYDITNCKTLYKDPENVEEIRRFVLMTLILSAMAVVNDGTHWSYLLHKLYQVYPESISQSVVSHLRKKRVIAIKKKSNRCDLKRSLRSTNFPYKFSVTYSNAMLTKCPVRIFKESKDLLDSLKSLKSGTHVELKGDVPPGYAAAVLSLTQMKQLSLHTQIPPQIILFDSSLSKEARTNIVERMINTLSDKESMELTRLLNDESMTSEIACNKKDTAKGQSESGNAMTDAEEMPSADVSLMGNSQISEVQKFASASRFALYLLRHEMSQPPIEKVQHSQDYIVLNSCRVYCRLKPTDDIPDLPVNTADIIEKVPDELKTVQSEYVRRDRIKLSEEQISEISKLLSYFVPPEAFLTNRNYPNLIESLYEQYSAEELQEAKSIFNYIYTFGAKGVAEKLIWQEFRTLSGKFTLFEHLSIFQKAHLVIRVGVLSFNYVCICFANDWILTSYPLSDLSYKNIKVEDNLPTTGEVPDNPNISIIPYSENDNESNDVQSSEINSVSVHTQDTCISCIQEREADVENQVEQIPSASKKNIPALCKSEKLYFVPRTWRNPDGSLNKPVFFSLLSTVMSYIISIPGTSTVQVCEQFLQVLPPVQTLELIEILEKASCIYKYYCKSTKKASLFSASRTILVTENPQPEDLDHLEPFPDAVCKIADLRNAMNSHLYLD